MKNNYYLSQIDEIFDHSPEIEEDHNKINKEALSNIIV